MPPYAQLKIPLRRRGVNPAAGRKALVLNRVGVKHVSEEPPREMCKRLGLVISQERAVGRSSS